MSTKTIAVEISVYEKLRREKRDSESFTKTIDRLIENAGHALTCERAVAEAGTVWGSALDAVEEKLFHDAVEWGRKENGWDVERPE